MVLLSLPGLTEHCRSFLPARRGAETNLILSCRVREEDQRSDHQRTARSTSHRRLWIARTRFRRARHRLPNPAVRGNSSGELPIPCMSLRHRRALISVLGVYSPGPTAVLHLHRRLLPRRTRHSQHHLPLHLCHPTRATRRLCPIDRLLAHGVQRMCSVCRPLLPGDRLFPHQSLSNTRDWTQWQATELGRRLYPFPRRLLRFGCRRQVSFLGLAPTARLTQVSTPRFMFAISFLNALYFVTQSFITTGFGDVVPPTDASRGVFILLDTIGELRLSP